MQERYEENCPAAAIFIPTQVLSCSGSTGMISVCCIQTPLKDFGRKDRCFFLNTHIIIFFSASRWNYLILRRERLYRFKRYIFGTSADDATWTVVAARSVYSPEGFVVFVALIVCRGFDEENVLPVPRSRTTEQASPVRFARQRHGCIFPQRPCKCTRRRQNVFFSLVIQAYCHSSAAERRKYHIANANRRSAVERIYYSDVPAGARRKNIEPRQFATKHIATVQRRKNINRFYTRGITRVRF